MSYLKRNVDISFNQIVSFLKRGYLFREIVLKGISIKILSKIFSILKYKFFDHGKDIDIDFRAVIDGCKFIKLGNNIFIHKNAWISVPLLDMQAKPKKPVIEINDGTRIGPGCVISACKKLVFEEDVLLGPNVTILDHNHEYDNINIPISKQGIKFKGSVIIGKGSWLGVNSVVCPSNKDIIIGEHCIIGANSVLTKSTPPYTVFSGSPAKCIKKYNHNTKKWMNV